METQQKYTTVNLIDEVYDSSNAEVIINHLINERIREENINKLSKFEYCSEFPSSDDGLQLHEKKQLIKQYLNVHDTSKFKVTMNITIEPAN